LGPVLSDKVVGDAQEQHNGRGIVERQAANTPEAPYRTRGIGADPAQVPIQPDFQLVPGPGAYDVPRIVFLSRLPAQVVQIFIG
jgi:hypothetical protein